MRYVTFALGVTAALLHGYAYWLYCRQAKIGISRPKSASWSVWAFLATLNALSFTGMNGDLVIGLQFFMGSIACIITFTYMLFLGRLAWPRGRERLYFTLGLLASVTWWMFEDSAGAIMANMIVLAAFLISFKPTFSAVRRDPFVETARPWVLWTIAFGITIANIVLRHGERVTFIMPAVLLLAHGSIAFFSRKTRQDAAIKNSRSFEEIQKEYDEGRDE